MKRSSSARRASQILEYYIRALSGNLSGEDLAIRAREIVGGDGTLDFVFYFDGPKNAENQVSMWTSYLQKLNRPFLVIVRNSRSQRVLREMGLPVLQVKRLRDLELAETLGARVAFYANNGMRNLHLLRFNSLVHVQLLHGESDKASSFNPVSGMYDLLFVAGQAAIDRYSQNDVFIPLEKFRIVGRPQTQGIDVALERPDGERGTVFYATTWRGFHNDTDLSSIRYSTEIVQKLLGMGKTVIFRPHPFSYQEPEHKKIINEIAMILKKDNAANQRQSCVSNDEAFSFALPDINDCINRADILLCDVSSVIADWLYSAKPFIAIDTHDDHVGFAKRNPTTTGGYYIDNSLSDLEKAILDASGLDRMRKTRIEMRKYVLGVGLGDDPVSLFTDTAEDVIANFDKIGVSRRSIERSNQIPGKTGKGPAT